jgi:trehalose 6-phosphate phosphatase
MTPPASGVAHLLPHWNSVAARISASSRVVIFLDFDGTLVDIAPRPELVRLKSAARRVLQRLARHPRVTLVVVSGRRRRELLEHIGIRGIHYFGLYGWESDAKCSLPGNLRVALKRAHKLLTHNLRAYPDVWIEDKRSTLSIHLLDVSLADQKRLRPQIHAWLNPFRRVLRVEANIRDMEVLPRSFPGKGLAVRKFLTQPAFRRALPFYFGDDFSDESGFAAVRRGVSVHVGKKRATQARYNVRTPAEVAAVLAKIEAALPKP